MAKKTPKIYLSPIDIVGRKGDYAIQYSGAGTHQVIGQIKVDSEPLPPYGHILIETILDGVEYPIASARNKQESDRIAYNMAIKSIADSIGTKLADIQLNPSISDIHCFYLKNDRTRHRSSKALDTILVHLTQRRIGKKPLASSSIDLYYQAVQSVK